MPNQLLNLVDISVSVVDSADVALESAATGDLAVVAKDKNPKSPQVQQATPVPQSPAPQQTAPPIQTAPAPQHGYWAQYGNYAQWAAVIAAILIGLVNVGLTLSSRSSDKSDKASDEHIGKLIGEKLDPAIKDMNGQFNKLTLEVGQLEGRFQELDEGQKRLSSRVGQQESLNKLQDPNRSRNTLAEIRAEIQIAITKKQPLPRSQLADYVNALHALPSSIADYWGTVATIINYQSLLNQINGQAPDPKTVAKRCIPPGFTNNDFRNIPYRNCVAYLDTNAFENDTFQDSVIHYAGGPVVLRNVTFINCAFILDFLAEQPTPTKTNLLLAILDSPDQKSIRVSD